MATHRRPDRHLVVLIVVSGLLLASLAPLLVFPNLVADYPLMGGDSQDWIANGLALAGADVRFSARPPLLPLVIALLEHLGALPVLPVLLLIVQLSAAVVLYLMLRRRVPGGLALAASLGLMGCFSWLGLGLEVMADVPAACLLLAGTACLVAAAERDPAWFAPAGLLLGLSAVTQPVALLIPLPAAVALMVHRRDLLRAPSLWLGAVLFAAPTIAWAAYKRAVFVSTGDVLLRHWSLLGPHLGGVAYSVVSGLSLLGAVGAGLAAAGLVLMARRARTGFSDTLLVGVVVTVAVFFVLGYRFHAKRLLVDLLPFAVVAVAEALVRIRGGWLRWSATALFVACAWLPLPGGSPGASAVALWPLPPVFLRTDAGAGTAPRPVTTARLEVATPAETVRWSIPARLLEARNRRRPVALPDPARFADDRRVVWIHDGEVAPADRYAGGLRLGNLLRKRVTHTPLWAVRPLGTRLEGGCVADVEGLRLYRVRLPAPVDGSWVVAARSGGRADAWAAALPDTPGQRGLSGLAVADRIAAATDERLVVVVADPGAAPSLPLLPFLLRPADLYVMGPRAFRASVDELGAVGGARLEAVDGATLWQLHVTGLEFVLVDYTGAQP